MGGRPIAARCLLSAGPYKAFTLLASRSHSSRLPVPSGEAVCPAAPLAGGAATAARARWKHAHT